MKRQLEIQTNHKHLTPDGLPSYHVYDEHKKNVAAFVSEEDALLFVEAVAEAERRAGGEASPSNDKDHSPIGAVGASKPESNSAAPIG